MTRPFALAIALTVAAAQASRQQDGPHSSATIDLVERFDAAEKRAPAGPITVLEQTVGGSTRRSIAVPTVSRIIWRVTIPKGAELRTAIALDPRTRHDTSAAILFRIGISDEDDRTYEELYARRLEGGATAPDEWLDVGIDLGKYAGFQWSLFYRPDGRQWNLIFNTGPARRGGAKSQSRALWASPGVYEAP